jgi:hypothetical protein
MHKVDLYRHYAHQAVETAQEATSRNEKAVLLEIAEAWLRLADATVAKKPSELAASKHLH